MASAMSLVFWIIDRPMDVTLAAMGTHGSMPLVAPMAPYALFMVILKASCRALHNEAVQASPASSAAAISFLACLRKRARSSSRDGTTPRGLCANLNVPNPVSTVSNSTPRSSAWVAVAVVSMTRVE